MRLRIVFCGSLVWLSCLAVEASDCTKTSSGLVALTELRENLYKGKQGGLYPGGANTRPLAHELAGLEQARAVRPLDANGQPFASGKIVFLSVGMSNTTQEFSTFKALADSDPDRNPNLVVVDGAQGGMTASIISNLNTANGQLYWTNVDSRLRSAGVTAAQVQVAWVKEADAGPTAAFPNDAMTLKPEFAAIARILMSRFPNIRLAYWSSRIYAGYASSTLNPEPFAYQSAFAVKWLIEDQINGAPDLNFEPVRGPVQAPWLSWGPYLWADGLNARVDGLSYVCSDFATDGTHPAAGGARNKVALALLDFLKSDATSRSWFLNARSAAARSAAMPTLNGITTATASTSNPMSAGMALVNLSTAEVPITVQAMAPDGGPVQGEGFSNPIFLSLAPGAQVALMDTQVFGPAIAGIRTPLWLRLDGPLEEVAGFFLLFRVPSTMAGAVLSRRPVSSWTLPEMSLPSFLQLHLANRGGTAASVTVQLIQGDGAPRTTPAGLTIPAGGALSTTVAGLWPQVSTAETDYVRVMASQGVDALELFARSERVTAVLGGLDTSAGSTTLYCPQYVTGGGWQTRLSIINLDETAGSVALEYCNDSGTPQAPPRLVPIAARGKLLITDPKFFVNAGDVLSQGYIRISGDTLHLTGSVVFEDPQAASFAAALPLVARLDTTAVCSQIASGASWYTGLALLNAGNLAAAVDLEVFDSRGKLLARGREDLGPRQRRSQILTQLFPGLEGQELNSGYVKVFSDRPLALYAVYGLRDGSLLSAIPAQSIP